MTPAGALPPPARPGFGPFSSPGRRRRVAVRALAAVLFLLAVDVLWALVGIATVGHLVPVPDDGWFDAYDRIALGLSLVYLPFLGIAAVAFIAWQRLVIRNTLFLGCEHPEPGPTLATLAWFVPIVNLVLPFLSLRQVARWSRAPGARDGPLLPLWWASWLLAGPFAVSGAVVTQLGEGPGPWVAGTAVQAVGTLLSIASGVLAVRVVDALSRGQEERVRAGVHVSRSSRSWTAPPGRALDGVDSVTL